jgi:hypothetical protein
MLSLTLNITGVSVGSSPLLTNQEEVFDNSFDNTFQ